VSPHEWIDCRSLAFQKAVAVKLEAQPHWEPIKADAFPSGSGAH
jgi:hypothetical protein